MNSSYMAEDRQEQGAYVLYLDVQQSLSLRAGALNDIFLPAGYYLYIGSARRGIAGRIARHRRLAERKSGKLHWHVDYLLTHPQIRLAGEAALAGRGECAVSRQIASAKGVTAPVPGFGSTDCRSGCRAHLYRLNALQGWHRVEKFIDHRINKYSKESQNGQGHRTTLPRTRKKVY